jgi:hypothetical protein
MALNAIFRHFSKWRFKNDISTVCPLKIGDPLAILGLLGHKGAIAGTERLDGSEAAFGHKADTCHLRGSRIGFM